eukprot:gnl/Dysnectes_brevis/8648_a15522_212.p1 GENE.gnl/Dysnectes_brevis/8648_a15522_212~~gnl/Dysnectes_brevis/8648_a15522_212.p1  ORF type:complete len:535 (+),score=66.84 gnl/Dysnectes_brevis/8648_a15522_212:69-1607(+)
MSGAWTLRILRPCTHDELVPKVIEILEMGKPREILGSLRTVATMPYGRKAAMIAAGYEITAPGRRAAMLVRARASASDVVNMMANDDGEFNEAAAKVLKQWIPLASNQTDWIKSSDDANRLFELASFICPSTLHRLLLSPSATFADTKVKLEASALATPDDLTSEISLAVSRFGLLLDAGQDAQALDALDGIPPPELASELSRRPRLALGPRPLRLLAFARPLALSAGLLPLVWNRPRWWSLACDALGLTGTHAYPSRLLIAEALLERGGGGYGLDMWSQILRVQLALSDPRLVQPRPLLPQFEKAYWPPLWLLPSDQSHSDIKLLAEDRSFRILASLYHLLEAWKPDQPLLPFLTSISIGSSILTSQDSTSQRELHLPLAALCAICRHWDHPDQAVEEVLSIAPDLSAPLAITIYGKRGNDALVNAVRGCVTWAVQNGKSDDPCVHDFLKWYVRDCGDDISLSTVLDMVPPDTPALDCLPLLKRLRELRGAMRIDQLILKSDRITVKDTLL